MVRETVGAVADDELGNTVGFAAVSFEAYAEADAVDVLGYACGV